MSRLSLFHSNNNNRSQLPILGCKICQLYGKDSNEINVSIQVYLISGFPSGSVVKTSPTILEPQEFDPWVGKIPWERAQQPTPIFLPEESHGRGAWQATVHGVTELDTTEAIQHNTAYLTLLHFTLLHFNITAFVK